VIYDEEKPSGVAFPLFVILLAMVAIGAALMLNTDHVVASHVSVPAASRIS
jgi:hypothetical protein